MRSIVTSLLFLLTAGSAFAADPSTVPEPGTLALVGLAAAAAFVLRKKK